MTHPLVIPTTEQSNPWVTRQACAMCQETGRIPDGAPWEAEFIECPDCGGSGQVKRDWLREAFLFAQGRTTFDVEARHLQVLTAFYREQVSALLGEDVPATLERISNTLAGIGATCLNLGATKEAA